MGFNVKQLADKAFTAKIQEFAQLADNVTEMLKAEERRIGNLTVTGKLVVTEPEGEAIVVGDLHGDIDTLMQILEDSKFIDKMRKKEKVILVFLGDYGDRGVNSAEVFFVVLKLKEAYPLNVVLLRGNHEGPNDLLPSPHDLPMHLQRTFGPEWSLAYEKLRILFEELHLAVIVKEKIIMLHGGVPSTAKSIEDLAFANRKHPSESHLEEILWSDPEESLLGTRPSPRGAGEIFGMDVTEKFLRMLNVRMLIRGHEPAETGYKINHDGRILTLFSRKGEPYYNSKAAYLKLNLGLDATSVYQVLDSVTMFK